MFDQPRGPLKKILEENSLQTNLRSNASRASPRMVNTMTKWQCLNNDIYFIDLRSQVRNSSSTSQNEKVMLYLK